MTTRKYSAWLALLMSFLIALPPAAWADDTELFTTSINPNVLLMLDSTGSMSTTATGTSVGDLDGDNHSNTRMDSLWKVVYTFLNADLSVPAGGDTGGSTTYTCRTAARIRTRDNPYTSIQVDGTNWSYFSDHNTIGTTVYIGSESFVLTGTSTRRGAYYLNFSSKSFRNGYSTGTTVSSSATSSGNAYIYPYPSNNTEAMGSDYLNNLTTTDESTLRMRIGLMTFTTNNNPSVQILQQVQSTAPNTPPFSPSYQTLWTTARSNLQANGMTPAALALQRATNFFDTADRNQCGVVNKDYIVMVTDGEDTAGGAAWSPTSGTAGTSGMTNSGDTYSTSNPYPQGQTDRNNSVIYQAYRLAQRSTPVQLFAIGVGVGTPATNNTPQLRVLREVLRRAAEQKNVQATAAQYTTISNSADNTSRAEGYAYFADSADDLQDAFIKSGQRMSSEMFSFTSPTVASVRMTDRNYVYMASFQPSSPPNTLWVGHLKACSTDNLSLCNDNVTPTWDAGGMLASATAASRNIYTSDNTGGRQLFNTSNNYITYAMLGVDNNAVRNSVIDYVRGVNHDNNYKLGDIFHSKPVVVGPPSQFYFDDGYSTAIGSTSFFQAKSQRKRVVYVGTNDGMLHAFLSGTYQTSGPHAGLYDSGTGAELFGYIPRMLLGNIADFLPDNVNLTSHGYYVDSSPRVADVWIDANNDGIKQSGEWKTVLTSGLRKGGNGFFALDVTNPDDSNYPGVLWEYTDNTLGQSWSEPFIGKIRVRNSSWTTGPTDPVRDRWVAIFGGGKSDDGSLGKSLVVLDIATGRPLKTFTTIYTASGTVVPIDNMIVASPMAVLDANGYIRFAYVPDLNGSLYKFDLRATGTDNSYSEWRGYKIFQASAGGQPAYHRVEAGSVTENLRYLYFGTGDQDWPITNKGTGKFYAIRDADTDNTLLGLSNLENLSASINSVTGGTVGSTKSGWYINFDNVSVSGDSITHSGEKVLSDPVVFYNSVYFTTFTPNLNDPCNGGVARVYGLNMLNAGAALASLTTGANVPYYVFSGGAGSAGGVPSSPSLSINPFGQSSLFIGFSTGIVREFQIASPPHMKTIKSWKEIF